MHRGVINMKALLIVGDKRPSLVLRHLPAAKRGRAEALTELEACRRVSVADGELYRPADPKEGTEFKALPRTTALAARLRHLGIKEIRVPQDASLPQMGEVVSALAEATELPSGDEFTLAQRGDLEYCLSPLVSIREKAEALNSKTGEDRKRIFARLSSDDRASIVTSLSCQRRQELFRLLSEGEKRAAVSIMIEDLTSAGTNQDAALVFWSSSADVQTRVLSLLPAAIRAQLSARHNLDLFQYLSDPEKTEAILGYLTLFTVGEGLAHRWTGLNPHARGEVFLNLAIDQKLAVLLAVTNDQRRDLMPLLDGDDRREIANIYASSWKNFFLPSLTVFAEILKGIGYWESHDGVVRARKEIAVFQTQMADPPAAPEPLNADDFTGTGGTPSNHWHGSR